MPSDLSLPQPNDSALTINSALEILLDAVPFAAPLYRKLLNSRIESGRQFLVEAIRSGGRSEIERLTPAQKDFILPAAYRFFEQVRLGEYEHNLRILARLLNNEIYQTVRDPDVGRLARAARHLEMAQEASVVGLAAVEHFLRGSGTDSINAVQLQEALGRRPSSEPAIGHAVLQDLSWRGLLRAPLGMIFRDDENAAHYRTAAYGEVIEAAYEVGAHIHT